MRNPVPVRPSAATDIASLSFERAAFAAWAAASGKMSSASRAHEACQQLFPHDRRALELIVRTTQTVGTVGGWGSDVASDNPTAAFFGSLGAESAMGRLIAMGVSADLEGLSATTVPTRPDGPVTVPWVGEGEPIPVRSNTFGAADLGPPRKLATMSVLSAEVASRAGAEAIVRRTLREDAGLALDAAYLSTDAGSSSGVAGLLNGVIALSNGSFGTVKADLAELAGAVSLSGSGMAYFVTTPTLAARAHIHEPELRNFILPSRAVPAGRVIGIDPAAIAHGFDGAPDIRASREAVVHMSDDPDPIVDSTAADPTRSLWQTDAVALRLIVDLAFVKLNTGATAYIEGVQW